MILDMCDYTDLLVKPDSPQPKAIGGNTNKYKIVAAVII